MAYFISARKEMDSSSHPFDPDRLVFGTCPHIAEDHGFGGMGTFPSNPSIHSPVCSANPVPFQARQAERVTGIHGRRLSTNALGTAGNADVARPQGPH